MTLDQSVWRQCVDQLRSSVTEQDINTYISSLHVEAVGNQLRLLAPNIFVRSWLESNILDQIEQKLRDLVGAEVTVVLAVGSADAPKPVSDNNVETTKTVSVDAPPVAASHPRYQDVLSSTADSDGFTFNNFVEGASNELGLAAARQVAENPGLSKSYNPLYVYGASGLGKTHLMHAIRNQVLAANPAARVALINTNQYLNHMVDALQNHRIEEFKDFYNSLDVLLMDDVHFLGRKERTQEEFFHTFNTLIDRGKQIVLTCDQYPDEIPDIDERLKTRFGAGLPVQINPPDLETRVGILVNKAKLRGWDLPNETAFFVAEHVQSNVRSLEGALSRVIAHASLRQTSLSVDLASEALQDVIQRREQRVTIDNIKRTAADYYKLSLTDLESTSRRRNVARPRQLAMALSKELTRHSLPDIGREFGGRDHTTVLHACRTIVKLRKEDPTLEADYQTLRRTLLA